jgi:hypothetical protein
MQTKKDYEAPFADSLSIRIALLRKGYSVNSWAKTHGYKQPSVFNAIYRTHQGPIVNDVRRKLKHELGL